MRIVATAHCLTIVVLVAALSGCANEQSLYAGTSPPTVNCRASGQADFGRCGRLCDSGFWASATAEDVQAVLDGGASVNRTNDDGYSPLHLAARCARDPGVFSVLLDAGADPNRKGPKSVRPLHFAAAYADRVSVGQLIDSGADLEAQTRRDWTPLHYAANLDSLDGARVLLGRGANVDAADVYQYTPLDLALRVQASSATVAVLIEADAPLWTTRDSGWSPLHIAASKDARPEVIELLVGAGASVNALNSRGETPLDVAFRYAASVWTIDALVDASGGIDAKDPRGRSMLHRAVETPHPRLVRRLLERGADPNARDQDGRSPLHLISTRGRHVANSDQPELSIISYLVQHGAMLELPDRNGWTALHWAAHEGGRRVIASLVEEGADVSARTNSGETPCDLAAALEDDLWREDALTALACDGHG
ncbi:MAG: hypothetical protein F4Y95_03255 [Chloroflexi bacterium]|nr:hypothetical protein [Chloroflexota bacterium]